MLRQLTDQDALYLYIETPETPAHVGGVSLVELPEGYAGSFYRDYRELIATRLQHVPFLHSKLAPLPLDLDRPFWVEAEVDLDHHVRHATLPAPGGMAELEELVGRLHSTLLDRARPLWEFYVIDGLASGQVAIYVKIHHAAMDGASSQALIGTMYDPTPALRELPAPPARQEVGEPLKILQGLVAHLARQEILAARYVPELLEGLVNLALPDPETFRWKKVPSLLRTPRTILNVAVEGRRNFAARSLPLGEVKRIARQTGTTVNDVVLAVCAGALRAWLLDRRALPEAPLVALVPISMRGDRDATTANRNGMYQTSLATDVAHPLARLLEIHRSSSQQRRRFENLWPLVPPDLPAPGLGLLVHSLVELYGKIDLARFLPLPGNLVISNVAGPPAPLHVAGARIQTMVPCSIPFHGTALNITVESYCDRLDFGLVACRRAVPELAAIGDRLETSFAALREAVVPRVAADAPPAPAAAPARARRANGTAARR